MLALEDDALFVDVPVSEAFSFEHSHADGRTTHACTLPVTRTLTVRMLANWAWARLTATLPATSSPATRDQPSCSTMADATSE